MGRLADAIGQGVLKRSETVRYAAPAALGAGLVAASPVAGGAYGAGVMAGEGADSPNIAAGAGVTAYAAGIGAVGGAAGGMAGGGLIASKLNRNIGTGMKFGGFAGTALAASVSAGLVGRGLSSTVHAPRHVNKMQTAMTQGNEGRIRGMDI